RSEAAAAYDSARGVTVLFGGWNASGLLHDTWEWDGTRWALRSSSGPVPASPPAIAYDSRRAVTVMFGRFGNVAQMWEWDGMTWTLRPGYSQAAVGEGMVYDAARGVMVLCGEILDACSCVCYGGQGCMQTWEWDGATWTLRADSGPSVRSGHTMAYDSTRHT